MAGLPLYTGGAGAVALASVAAEPVAQCAVSGVLSAHEIRQGRSDDCSQHEAASAGIGGLGGRRGWGTSEAQAFTDALGGCGPKEGRMRRTVWRSCARNADVPRTVPTKATAVNAKETVVMAVLMRNSRTASVSLLSKRGSWTSLKSLSNVSDTSVASQKKDVKCSARNALHNVEQRSVHAARCPCSTVSMQHGVHAAVLLFLKEFHLHACLTRTEIR